MCLLWRTLRFWSITGALLYTFTSLTPHIFNLGNRLGRHLQTDGQRQAHATSFAQLRAGSIWGEHQQPPATTELLGADDQPASLREYYRDAH